MAEKSARDGHQPKNIIAERMRLARQQQQPRLSQEDLATRVAAYGVHINRLSIGRIEAGKRIVLDFELRAIAAALYVPVSWLIGEEDIWGTPEDIPQRPQVLTRKRSHR